MAQEPLSEGESVGRGDNSAEAVEFVKLNLQSRFDEANARKLFSFYALDENSEKLEAPDVRKLLLDILAAKEWPLVVPDEALDVVLYELCLNGKGAISWVEFKSFFVFLQELPIEKLFQLVTKLYTREQLEFGRLIHIRNSNISNKNEKLEKSEENDDSKNMNQDDNNNNNSSNDNKNNKNDENNNNNNNNSISYDRQAWKQIISQMIEEAGPIFIYFLDGNSLLALVVGRFENKLTESVSAEIVMDGMTYVAEMRGFDCENDVFPPITRAGGMKSKVARKIADTYLHAKKWDENNLKVGEKVTILGQKAEAKWKQIDEKYKVKEKVNEATKSAVDSIKTFDETHQISKRVSDTAKDIDEKYKIREKVSKTVQSIKENPTFMSFSQRLSRLTQTTIQTVDDISKETKQLVNEKETTSKDNGATNDEAIDNTYNGDSNNVNGENDQSGELSSQVNNGSQGSSHESANMDTAI